MLLQLFIGEGVDAARQCTTWQWISGHDPSCGATVMIRVPRINGKTTPRHITLFPPFAYLLWEWSTGKPLVAKMGSSGLPQDKASSQTCHYFLATVCRWTEEMLGQTHISTCLLVPSELVGIHLVMLGFVFLFGDVCLRILPRDEYHHENPTSKSSERRDFKYDCFLIA